MTVMPQWPVLGSVALHGKVSASLDEVSPDMNISMCVGAQVLNLGTIANGAGPIYLSDLHCDGNEMSLLDCVREDSQPTGLHSCDHQQDVAVRCTGEYRTHTHQCAYVEEIVIFQMWMSALLAAVLVTRFASTLLVASIAVALLVSP